MAMATRCPGCETVFRVTPQQLQAHGGQVRCGRCMTVFDGFRGLATLPDAAAAGVPEPPADKPEAATEPPGAGQALRAEATRPASGDIAGDAVVPAQPRERVATPAPEIPEFGLEPADEKPPPVPKRLVTTEAAPPRMPGDASMAPAIALDADGGDEYLEPLPRRTWPWWVGSTLLLIALVVQGAYYYRSDLAVQYPALKPVLVELCQLAGCRVPLPQRPRLINIEASDLQVVDPARPGVIRLTATLRNHASHDVGYPVLDLVLTNTREHTLARRIFMPAEYLERGRDPDAGIPAKAEVTVGIELDTGDLGAAGFRLDLLPAPAR